MAATCGHGSVISDSDVKASRDRDSEFVEQVVPRDQIWLTGNPLGVLFDTLSKMTMPIWPPDSHSREQCRRLPRSHARWHIRVSRRADCARQAQQGSGVEVHHIPGAVAAVQPDDG